jgi:hypothetical protein
MSSPHSTSHTASDPLAPPDLVTIFNSPVTSPHASVAPQTATPSARVDSPAVPYYASAASSIDLDTTLSSSSRMTSPLAGSDFVPSAVSRESSLSDVAAAAAAADDDDDAVVVGDDNVEMMVALAVAWAA